MFNYLLRNREFLLHTVLMLLAGLLFLPLCFWLDRRAGLAALGLFAALFALSAGFTAGRYRELANLSAQLERLALGDRDIDIRRYTEGELSILSTELFKLTSTLSHQMNRLSKDKSFLADTLADISHQLKTPLASLSMLADLLEDPNLPGEKRVEFLGGIRASLDRILWLVSSLLKLSRLDAGAVSFQLERSRLADVIRQAVEPLGILAEGKGQSLALEIPEHLSLRTDRRWLAEAVGNLVKNCVEHAPEGGTVRVRCTRNALYTEILVDDDGPGFAPEDLPHLFERFYRGKGAGPDSVGIGLALTKGIVRGLGGTVSAFNSPGGGAGFRIKLYGGTVV